MRRPRPRRPSPLAAFVAARPASRPALPRRAAPAAPHGEGGGPVKVWLPFELQRRARACAYGERIPYSRLVAEALAEAVDRYEKRRGKPYEPAPSRLPGGRPARRR